MAGHAGRRLLAGALLGLAGCADPGALLHHARAFAVDPADLALGSSGIDLHVIEAGQGPMLQLDLRTGDELSRFSPGAAARFAGIAATAAEGGDGVVLLDQGDSLVRVDGARAETVAREDAATTLLAGGLLDGAVVSLSEHGERGCEVVFGDAALVSVPDDLCLSETVGTAVAPGPGLFLVTNPAGTWSVAPDGTVVGWDAPGSAVVFEPLSGAVITAELGGPELRAHLPDGEELWATTIGEPVLSLAAVGGGDLVLASSPGSLARLVHLDALSGQAVRAVELPRVPRVLSAGEVGIQVGDRQFASVVAIGFPDEVHVFGLNLTGGEQ